MCCFPVCTGMEIVSWTECLLHAHCHVWYIRVGCPPTCGRFTHAVVDEATQGIDPSDWEKGPEDPFDSLVAGKNPVPTDSRWRRFPSMYKQPYLGHMSVARPLGWFMVFISGTRAKESEVHGWRQSESLLSSLSSIELGTNWVACILFVHHMSPSENCHNQAHVTFSARSQSVVPQVEERGTRS